MACTHTARSPLRAARSPLREACSLTCARVDIFVSKGDPDGCMVNENSLSSGSDVWPHRMYAAATPLATRYLPLARATLLLLLCCLLASCCLQLATRHLPATRYVALLWAEGHERGLYETVGNENSTQAHLMKSSA